MRIGVRRLISCFFLSGGPKKYCAAKDATVNPIRAENTHGFVITESNTAFGMGVSKLFWCHTRRMATIGTTTAIIRRAFHTHDNNLSLIGPGLIMNHQLNRQ
jgi:hypothetical protein